MTVIAGLAAAGVFVFDQAVSRRSFAIRSFHASPSESLRVPPRQLTKQRAQFVHDICGSLGSSEVAAAVQH